MQLNQRDRSDIAVLDRRAYIFGSGRSHDLPQAPASPMRLDREHRHRRDRVLCMRGR